MLLKTSHSLLVGVQTSTATEEDGLAVSYYFYHKIQQSHFQYLPKWIENLCSHKSLHIGVYSGSVYNCQNLEATGVSFSRWMN